MNWIPATNPRIETMRSEIYWAFLGLLIERPSYGYQLRQRFEQIYGDTLRLSSSSHVYAALDALRSRALIEVAPESETFTSGSSRQPKVRYRATAEGVRCYRDRLIAQTSVEHRDSRLLARQLAVFTHEPQAGLQVVKHYERARLQEAARASIARSAETPAHTVAGLIARLACEETRLVTDAQLTWARYARREFEALAEDRALRDDPA